MLIRNDGCCGGNNRDSRLSKVALRPRKKPLCSGCRNIETNGSKPKRSSSKSRKTINKSKQGFYSPLQAMGHTLSERGVM